jgi:hypothetical protein
VDWQVTKRPVFHQLEDNLGDLAFEPIPGAWATIRKDTNMVLDVVGAR